MEGPETITLLYITRALLFSSSSSSWWLVLSEEEEGLFSFLGSHPFGTVSQIKNPVPYKSPARLTVSHSVELALETLDNTIES